MMNITPDLTNPLLNSYSDIQFAELFEIEKIQHLQDLFADAHGVASIITQPDGTPITNPSNFTRFCKDIIRSTEKGCANCIKSDALIGRHNPSGPTVQPCLSGGLWDAGASISVNGKHIASWLIGQVRNEEVDEQYMMKYAEKIGAVPNDFMEALNEVPVMSVNQFNKISKMLYAFANQLSEKAYNNLQLKIQITEQKQGEAALWEANQKLKLHFEQTPMAVIEWDHNFRVTQWNPSAQKIFGYSREEALGQHASFIIPESFRPFVNEILKRLLENTGGERSSNQNIHKNGQAIICEWYNTTLIDENGHVKGVASIVEDITERKTNEKNLLKSEQMLQSVLDNFPGVVFWKDAQSNYLGCNLAFAKGAGLNSSAEIAGKTDFDMPWAVSEAENYRADDFEVIKSGKDKMHIIEMQHQTDGHVMWLDTSKIPIYDSDDQIIGLIGVSTDITDLKQTQEVISAKNKELENYLYIASHDLRSPLVNIQGFSQRLQKQADTIKAALVDCPIDKKTKADIDEITNAGIPKTLNFIFSNVTKMDTLINGLLQISRTGRMAMSIRKIDMNNLFKTIIAAHNFQITELAAKVKIEDLNNCFGDENQLNQLFSNIIGNAIKYSDKNRQLVLEIASGTHYNKVIYTIKDTGIGIAPRHLEKIWDVFYRVDSGVSESGEGIGLSIAKRLVDKHKGKIWAESEVEKGSTFFVELQKNDFNE